MNTKKIDIDEVFNTLRQYYFQSVKSHCLMFLDGCLDDIEHDNIGEEYAHLNLDEIINSACIYNRDNAITLCASDNDDAYVENFGAEGLITDGRICFDRMACATLEADIQEMISRAGFDWNDIPGTVKKAVAWFEE